MGSGGPARCDTRKQINGLHEKVIFRYEESERQRESARSRAASPTFAWGMDTNQFSRTNIPRRCSFLEKLRDRERLLLCRGIIYLKQGQTYNGRGARFAAPRKQLIEREVFLKAKKNRPVSPKSIECRRFKRGDPILTITQESPNLPPR